MFEGGAGRFGTASGAFVWLLCAGAGWEAAGAGRFSFSLSFSLSSAALKVAVEAASRSTAAAPAQRDRAGLSVFMSLIRFSTSPLRESCNGPCSQSGLFPIWDSPPKKESASSPETCPIHRRVQVATRPAFGRIPHYPARPHSILASTLEKRGRAVQPHLVPKRGRDCTAVVFILSSRSRDNSEPYRVARTCSQK